MTAGSYLLDLRGLVRHRIFYCHLHPIQLLTGGARLHCPCGLSFSRCSLYFLESCLCKGSKRHISSHKHTLHQLHKWLQDRWPDCRELLIKVVCSVIGTKRSVNQRGDHLSRADDLGSDDLHAAKGAAGLRNCAIVVAFPHLV